MALSIILGFRLYRIYTDDLPSPTTDAARDPNGLLPPSEEAKSLVSFLVSNAVEALGVPLGLLIAHYIHAAAPPLAHNSQQPRQPYPWSFFAALVLSILEVIIFTRLARQPSYVFHIDATLPVGAIYFVFVWICDIIMYRNINDAKLGLEATQRLSETVARTKAD